MLHFLSMLHHLHLHFSSTVKLGPSQKQQNKLMLPTKKNKWDYWHKMASHFNKCSLLERNEWGKWWTKIIKRRINLLGYVMWLPETRPDGQAIKTALTNCRKPPGRPPVTGLGLIKRLKRKREHWHL